MDRRDKLPLNDEDILLDELDLDLYDDLDIRRFPYSHEDDVN